MNKLMALGIAVAAVAAFVATDTADAKRLGGGSSLGAQRQVTPRAAPAPSATPSTPSTAPMQSVQPKAAPAAAAPAASGMSRWLGPIAGIAAGLGIAALMSHLGLSEAFGSFLLIALVVVAGIFLVRMLLGRRSQPAAPMQYAGAGADRVEPRMNPNPTPRSFEPVMGNTAQTAMPAPAAMPAAATGVNPTGADRFPPGFNPAAFIEQSKLQFRKLQAAYDNGDRKALSEVLTPEMFAEVSRELGERGLHTATEVTRLDATILEVTTEGDRHWMSVHFTGMLREDGTVLPKDFDEVWNLVKPVDGSSGWQLAGIQQTNEVA